ncbi:hypothetical protein EON65_37755 [archaeon]|nr:MAG: hypothetical protein EON65_37755 [archaeon]
MDNEGNFATMDSLSLMRAWQQRLMVKGNTSENVGAVVFADIANVCRALDAEFARFIDFKSMSIKEKNRRLLYLFQKDLMPGISGQILENKDNRDQLKLKPVSKTAKNLAWIFLALVNAAMLFYIFLFAVSQDEYRQTAWAKSFAIWLVVEILLVSTCMVLFMHILLPSLIMKDVQAIKVKLVDSLVQYHKQLQSQDMVEKALGTTFNAAEYLFVSHRLASAFPKLKIAPIILAYHSVWPRQSYQHIVNISESYSKRFSALSRSFSMVVFFFINNLLTVPMSIQDMIIQMTATAVTGYMFLVHIQLYSIYPILVIIPTITIGVILHFMMQRPSRTGKNQAFMEWLKAKEPAEVLVVKEADDVDHSMQPLASAKGEMEAEELDGILLHQPANSKTTNRDRFLSTDSTASDFASMSILPSIHFVSPTDKKQNHTRQKMQGSNEARIITPTQPQPIAAAVPPLHSQQHVSRRQSVIQGTELLVAAQQKLLIMGARVKEESNSSISSSEEKVDGFGVGKQRAEEAELWSSSDKSGYSSVSDSEMSYAVLSEGQRGNGDRSRSYSDRSDYDSDDDRNRDLYDGKVGGNSSSGYNDSSARTRDSGDRRSSTSSGDSHEVNDDESSWDNSDGSCSADDRIDPSSRSPFDRYEGSESDSERDSERDSDSDSDRPSSMSSDT